MFNVEDAGVFQFDKEYKDLTPEKVRSDVNVLSIISAMNAGQSCQRSLSR